VSKDTRFDECARTYDDTVQAAIGASGESVHFFADLKVHLMARELGDRRPATILDFGCGIGNTTRAIAAGFPEARVIGFDVSTESLEVARQVTPARPDQVTYISTTENRLPIADASIAAAFTSCVFHHIAPADRDYWAKELRRILEPHAPLFLFEHNPYNPLTVRVVRQIPFDDGVILLEPRDATNLLRRAGFATSKPRYYFFFPAFLRILRRLEPALKRFPLGAQYFVVGR